LAWPRQYVFAREPIGQSLQNIPMVSIIVVELGLSSKEIVTSMPLEMGAKFPPKRNYNLRDRRLQPSYESRAIVVAVFAADNVNSVDESKIGAG